MKRKRGSLTSDLVSAKTRGSNAKISLSVCVSICLNIYIECKYYLIGIWNVDEIRENFTKGLLFDVTVTWLVTLRLGSYIEPKKYKTGTFKMMLNIYVKKC